jgi:hypothetical protein
LIIITAQPKSIIYPNGRLLPLKYGTAGGTNDKLSRRAALIDKGVGATHFVDYSYLGRDRTVISNYPAPGVELT